MKITKNQLKHIIKEELEAVLDETELSENIFDLYGRDSNEVDPAPGDENHWAHSREFVHPNNRGPRDEHEEGARYAWERLMDKREPGAKRPFPGDVKGGTGFKHTFRGKSRLYGGRYEAAVSSGKPAWPN